MATPIDEKIFEFFEGAKARLGEMYHVDLSDVELVHADQSIEEMINLFHNKMLGGFITRASDLGIDLDDFESWYLEHGPAIEVGVQAGLSLRHQDEERVSGWYDKHGFVFLKPKYDWNELSTNIVHELAHAVDDRVFNNYLSCSEPFVRSAISEGFATLVELREFRPFYGSSEIRSYCNRFDEGYLLGFEKRYGRESVIQPDKLVGDKLDKYLVGFNFFNHIIKAGHDPEEIMRHPPVSTLEVLNPDFYLESGVLDWIY